MNEFTPLLLQDRQECFRHTEEILLNAVLQKEFSAFIGVDQVIEMKSIQITGMDPKSDG